MFFPGSDDPVKPMACGVTGERVGELLKTRPNGRVFFSPDGLGGVWTEQVAFGTPFERTMAVMQRIEPEPPLVVCMDDSKGGGAISGLPIKVRRM